MALICPVVCPQIPPKRHVLSPGELITLPTHLEKRAGPASRALIPGQPDALPLFQTSAVLRAAHLPLLRSAVQSVTAAYSEVKGRYRLLGLIGGVAEIGVRQISQVAMRQATPLLESLEPQSR